MFHIDNNEVSWGKQRQSDSTCQLPCRRTLLGHSAKIGCKSLRKPEDSYFKLQLTFSLHLNNTNNDAAKLKGLFPRCH